MEESILKSTKQMLGISANYTAFDLEIITNINSVLSSLNQLGIGDAVPIEDETKLWADLAIPQVALNWVKTLIFLKVKLAFDPPGTSYLIEAVTKQIEEQEWRLNTYAEELKAAEEVVSP